jgi:hypothetical protein
VHAKLDTGGIYILIVITVSGITFIKVKIWDAKKSKTFWEQVNQRDSTG